MVNSIYLFQRALRLDDNLGLNNCINNSDKVYPIFCVDPRQSTSQNLFLSPFALGFMLQSLQDLNEQLKEHSSKLCILYGEPHIILKSFVEKHNIENIYLNKDYFQEYIYINHHTDIIMLSKLPILFIKVNIL